MNLNDIQLVPQMIADLYKDNLLETGDSGALQGTTAVKELGKNQKQILVIVSNPVLPFLADKELDFLTQILAACKLSLADIAIINSHGLGHTELQNAIEAKAKTVLAFDMDPLSIGLPVNFPFFQIQSFNKRKFLFSPSLSDLENDKSMKVKLWNALKILFAV